MNRSIICVFVLIISANLLSAQDTYRIDNSLSKVIISGTSNVHDWDMKASGIQAIIKTENEGNSLKKILEANFDLKVKNLESHSSIMDKKTLDAIKANKYSNITFSLTDTKDIRINGSSVSGIASGSLFIAGKTREVNVPFKGTYMGNSVFVIEGSKEIMLEDFGISPPTAMMGTLKTGDSVTVEFNLHFRNEEMIYSSQQLTTDQI